MATGTSSFKWPKKIQWENTTLKKKDSLDTGKEHIFIFNIASANTARASAKHVGNVFADLRRSNNYYFRSTSLGHICKTRKGLVVLEIFKFPYLTCGQYLGWGRYPFRGASADLPQISYNEMDVSFNMQFLYFLKGQLLIDVQMRYPETGWYEEHDYST